MTLATNKARHGTRDGLMHSISKVNQNGQLRDDVVCSKSESMLLTQTLLKVSFRGGWKESTAWKIVFTIRTSDLRVLIPSESAHGPSLLWADLQKQSAAISYGVETLTDHILTIRCAVCGAVKYNLSHLYQASRPECITVKDWSCIMNGVVNAWKKFLARKRHLIKMLKEWIWKYPA